LGDWPAFHNVRYHLAKKYDRRHLDEKYLVKDLDHIRPYSRIGKRTGNI